MLQVNSPQVSFQQGQFRKIVGKISVKRREKVKMLGTVIIQLIPGIDIIQITV